MIRLSTYPYAVKRALLNSGRNICPFCIFLVLAMHVCPVGAASDLPAGALASYGKVPFQNGSRIDASELSPDGKLLATLDKRSAAIWDTTTGQTVYRFYFDLSPARAGYQRGLAFSPDGKWLACGPSSEHIYVWNLKDGKEVRRFSTEFEMFGFSFFRFSADGAALIVESNGVVSWWNVNTGALIRKLTGLRIKQLSPDDKTFAVVDEGKKQVHIGDAQTGKITHTLPIAARRDSMEQGVLFLSDGATVAVVHHPDDPTRKFDFKEVQFWDISTGKRRDLTWPLPKTKGRESYRLALSPDAKVLYFPQEKLLRWSLPTGMELAPISVPWFSHSLAYPHPDGQTIILVRGSELCRWSIDAVPKASFVKDIVTWRHSAISPDGRWLALRGRPLEVYNVGSGAMNRIEYPRENSRPMAFSPDSKVLAVNEYYHIRFLSVPDLTEIKKLKPADVLSDATIHYSPDGRYLAVHMEVARLRLFDLANDAEIWTLGDVAKVLFTANGKKLLTTTRDRKSSLLRLHDIDTRKTDFEISVPADRGGTDRKGYGPQVSALAISPDNRVLAVAMTRGHVCFLDAATGQERARFLSMETPREQLGFGPNYDHATALAFSPDGQWLAVGGTDGLLRIWDVNTRQELHRLHGHNNYTENLTFTADGRRLVSYAGGEGMLWDLAPRIQEKQKAAKPR